MQPGVSSTVRSSTEHTCRAFRTSPGSCRHGKLFCSLSLLHWVQWQVIAISYEKWMNNLTFLQRKVCNRQTITVITYSVLMILCNLASFAMITIPCLRWWCLLSVFTHYGNEGCAPSSNHQGRSQSFVIDKAKWGGGEEGFRHAPPPPENVKIQKLWHAIFSIFWTWSFSSRSISFKSIFRY